MFPFFAPISVAWLCTAGAASFQHFYVRRQLRRSESEKSRYQQAIHWAAHEMRTPLTAIQGSSEIMTRYSLPEEKRHQLSEMINSESKRLARMIQTFLDVERLADGQMELKREPFAAADMVDTCLKRVAPIAERKQISILVDTTLDGGLTGDRELMEYAFYNLLTNAVKYSPAGTEIHVFSEIARRGTASGRARPGHRHGCERAEEHLQKILPDQARGSFRRSGNRHWTLHRGTDRSPSWRPDRSVE